VLDAFRRAVEDALRREQRRAIVASLLLALGALVVLWLGATWGLESARVAGIGWLDRVIAALGSLATLALCWMIFPAVTTLTLGFFLDGVVSRAERRHYPELGAARSIGIGAALASALRILLLAIVLNVIALPLYLIPAINLFVYYALNGYLIGREYFELVALRRLDGATARAMWRWHRGRLVLAGMGIVFLLSLPVVNLVAPVVAAAFMLHLFEGLRRATVERFAARLPTRLMKD
jgi:CysZ protein